ncbi:hypothetical protein AAY473_006253 [Plecturocebus cupreus]
MLNFNRRENIARVPEVQSFQSLCHAGKCLPRCSILKNIHFGPGAVARACNISTLRGRGGWITRGQEFKSGLDNMTAVLFAKSKYESFVYFHDKNIGVKEEIRFLKIGRVWWFMSVIPALWKAEGGILPENLGLLPTVECSGAVKVHCNLRLQVQVILQPQPPEGLQVYAIIGDGFCHVCQAALELLTSSDLPTSASRSIGITGVSHCTQPRKARFLRYETSTPTYLKKSSNVPGLQIATYYLKHL